MRTAFAPDRLVDPDIQEANTILRKCVHCGFCLATCPTYMLLGDELDSPRGRIYLAKSMLETDAPATPNVVKHLDRCLTCQACMTTCPSGVDYVHLVDRARNHVEATYTRPLADRLLRQWLSFLVPRPWLFRMSVIAGSLTRPFARLVPGPLGALLGSAPKRLRSPSHVDRPAVYPADGQRRHRVALAGTCAQQVLRPEINESTVRLLNRLGCEVVVVKGAGCCGAIAHHMGDEDGAKNAAKANIAAWSGEIASGDLDAIVFTASGCGVTLKDYGHLLRNDEAWADRAASVSALCRDVSELLLELDFPKVNGSVGEANGVPIVAYHTACSMQHGLGLRILAKDLLGRAGFDVRLPDETHVCCGSAGTYSILQPELSRQLRDRKAAHLTATTPDIIAAGNIGCITHLAEAVDRPVVHTVELLDWATGGPKPVELA